jgi:hypothetical protein
VNSDRVLAAHLRTLANSNYDAAIDGLDTEIRAADDRADTDALNTLVDDRNHLVASWQRLRDRAYWLDGGVS